MAAEIPGGIGEEYREGSVWKFYSHRADQRREDDITGIEGTLRDAAEPWV